MKYINFAMLVVSVAAVLVTTGCKSSRIMVTNNGSEVIQVTEESSDKTVQLGQGGTGYFREDSTVHIGDVSVAIGKE